MSYPGNSVSHPKMTHYGILVCSAPALAGGAMPADGPSAKAAADFTAVSPGAAGSERGVGYEPILTNNQGMPVAGDQNSPNVGPRGSLLPKSLC
ncbi:hypothetical protein [Lichenifustis flavocetrariae]|uniref:Uncharacterized protein n=1 Tax=Lichenifustis flavocetrariae TaxID=2949735 RepID=A0AA41ZBF7_9HYPH|nr:hypothetical protein [Lichenifustis flavocetrariae]MCW6512807.1 hypothetical protein [Lichenifustis flavocetrariae]